MNELFCAQSNVGTAIHPSNRARVSLPWLVNVPGVWFASSRDYQIRKLDLFLNRHLVPVRVTPQLGRSFWLCMHLKSSLLKIVSRHGSGYRHVKFFASPLYRSI